MTTFVRSFETLTLDDVPLVGGKNASLGEMVRELSTLGVRVPGGFAVTADGYRLFLSHNGLEPEIADLLDGLDTSDVGDLAARGRAIRDLIVGGSFPDDLDAAIRGGYADMRRTMRGGTAADDLATGPAVAVRSSATAEDLPEASFAGQQETFLNIHGEAALLDAVRRCYASLFTDRAIAYREAHGFEHLQVALSAGVQTMVRSDLGASGVLFTLDPESGFRDVVMINAAWGLGETVVRGVVDPDELMVFKPTLAEGFRPIVRRRLGSKGIKMIYDSRGGTRTIRTVEVPASDRSRFCISDDEALQLARWGMLIEEHYTQRAGEPRPMDIEWARDGRTGELYILQARPETVHAGRDLSVLETFHLREKGDVLASGRAVGARIGAGSVRKVRGAADMLSFQQGDVLVAEMTDPDWVPLMRKAAAIVTEHGGRTCHAAIVSRELGVPAIVGATGALTVLDDGMDVTVCCAEGETGSVYDGRLAFDVERLELKDLPETQTQLLLNVGDPGAVLDLAGLPAAGVGLARIEFIVTNAVKAHPMALLRWPELADSEAVETIATLTEGYATKSDFFVDRLAEGIATIAAAFYPRPVLVRLSDFKTNEYAGLIGGAEFEVREGNPMLGWRGASRYDHPDFREAFALECDAIRRAREEMGLTNIRIMVPFCRTLEEGRRVVDVLARHGLKRGENGLQVWVMCEIPSNALLAEDFGEIFDGLSIGSNDLTQLTLGVDRDSQILAPLFDERDPAVKRMIELAIEGAHAAGKPIGICGQAPSDFPDFAAFLVDRGIDSISLNPDALVSTLRRVSAHERGD